MNITTISCKIRCSLTHVVLNVTVLFSWEVLEVNLLFCLGRVIASWACFKPSSNSLLVCLLWNNSDCSIFVCGQHSLWKHIHEYRIVMRFLIKSGFSLVDMRLHFLNLCKLCSNLRFFPNCISFLCFDLQLRFSSLSCHLQHIMGVTLHSYN